MLLAAPACRVAGNVEHSVTARADEFGAIPIENGLRWAADSNWVGKQMKTNRAAMALIPKGPTEAEYPTKHQYGRRPGEYGNKADGCEPENQGNKRDFDGEEEPPTNSNDEGWCARIDWILAQPPRECRQGQQG